MLLDMQNPCSLYVQRLNIVVFLPPNTKGEIQPIDQTVMATFKRYFMRRLMNQAIKAIDKEGAYIKSVFQKL